MGIFRFHALEIPGLFLIEPEVYNDERGFFFEAYNYRDFKAIGLKAPLSRITIPGPKRRPPGVAFSGAAPQEAGPGRCRGDL